MPPNHAVNPAHLNVAPSSGPSHHISDWITTAPLLPDLISHPLHHAHKHLTKLWFLEAPSTCCNRLLSLDMSNLDAPMHISVLMGYGLSPTRIPGDVWGNYHRTNHQTSKMCRGGIFQLSERTSTVSRFFECAAPDPWCVLALPGFH